MNTAEGKIPSLNEFLDKVRDFRDDFIKGSIVDMPCRAQSIPDEFKPKGGGLPDVSDILQIYFGEKQHKFTLYFGPNREQKIWLINNTGLKDYKDMLDKIELESGKGGLENPLDFRYRESGVAEVLNEYVKRIYELSKPLLSSAVKKHRKCAAEVLKIIRNGGRPWTTRSGIEWYRIKQLDEIIEELEADSKQIEQSRPLAWNKWADVFGVSETTLRKLREQKKYHFCQVSARRWTLPKHELPAEYLEKYRHAAPQTQPKAQ